LCFDCNIGWVSVVLSPPYSFSDIPDLSGKVALVTGANSGIGYVTARELARKGAKVIGTSRSVQKGNEASKKIESELSQDSMYTSKTVKGSVHFMQLDLASFENVKSFATTFLSHETKLDMLVLNAGVMFPPFEKTVDGFELTIGTVSHIDKLFYISTIILYQCVPGIVIDVILN